MEIYNRKAIFAELKDYDVLSSDNAYIEITEWHNGEGVDVNIVSYSDQTFNLTFGQFEALKKLMKKIYK